MDQRKISIERLSRTCWQETKTKKLKAARQPTPKDFFEGPWSFGWQPILPTPIKRAEFGLEMYSSLKVFDERIGSGHLVTYEVELGERSFACTVIERWRPLWLERPFRSPGGLPTRLPTGDCYRLRESLWLRIAGKWNCSQWYLNETVNGCCALAAQSRTTYSDDQ